MKGIILQDGLFAYNNDLLEQYGYTATLDTAIRSNHKSLAMLPAMSAIDAFMARMPWKWVDGYVYPNTKA